MSRSSPLDDFAPTASWRNLRLRAELLARLRSFFAEAGFLEVETPLLSAEVVVERHLEPMRTVLAADARRPDEGRSLWLQASPEAAMKRLLAAGADAIYQVTRAFRNTERGRRHNPEFTLVEWYRRGDSMQDGMQFLGRLVDTLLGSPPARQISYGELFERYTDVDPHTSDADQLAKVARSLGVGFLGDASAVDRDTWLELLWTERVEPRLTGEAPTIVYDYPASQAALARIRAGATPVAERFELYAGGLELANGYHELLDPTELRRRFAQANATRVADGRPELPEPERLLAAMEHGLPACTGVALGFDRLVMVAAGAASIDEVIAFPIERA